VNVLLTNACNRRCPYCFAAERISFPGVGKARRAPAPPFIPRDAFDRVLAFARASRMMRLGVLGGEPSLHPEFPDLLEAAWGAGLETVVFTNGLWSERHLERVASLVGDGPRRRFRAVVNVNAPELAAAGQKESLDRFLGALGRHCTLSYNVYRPEFDAGFLVELIRRHRAQKRIRLGLAQPLAALPSEFVEVDDYARLTTSILSMAEVCDRNDVGIGFDCGFLLCAFTPEQIGRLTVAGVRFRASCAPALDVGTDLSVWACFPLSALSAGERLEDFPNAAALSKHFRERFGRLYRTGVLDECTDCRHLRRRQCSGGCAAHVYRRFQP